jgi:hypothetical protein
MSIEKTRGRQGDIRDSGYYRLFESQNTDDGYDEVAQKLARIVSKIHSASICNGNKLEEYIGNSPINNHIIKSLTDLKKGHYLNIKFDKDLWDGKKTQSTEIDYMLYETYTDTPRVCLFEVKDGDTFDTKKSREELNSLREVSILLKEHMPRVFVQCYVVLWNIKDPKKNGFKANLDENITLINGRIMCDMIGNLDYDNITHLRKDIGDKNLNFCIKELREIVRIYDEISENHKIKETDTKTETDTTVDVLTEMFKKDTKLE